MKYKTFSFIKIFSLGVGLVATIFIFLWVMDEMSFDKFHANAKNIYSVMTNNKYPDGRIETYPAASANFQTLTDKLSTGLLNCHYANEIHGTCDFRGGSGAVIFKGRTAGDDRAIGAGHPPGAGRGRAGCWKWTSARCCRPHRRSRTRPGLARLPGYLAKGAMPPAGVLHALAARRAPPVRCSNSTPLAHRALRTMGSRCRLPSTQPEGACDAPSGYLPIRGFDFGCGGCLPLWTLVSRRYKRHR